MTPGSRSRGFMVSAVLVAVIATLSACGAGVARPSARSSRTTLLGGSAAVPPPAGPTVEPPESIPSNCSEDVSSALRSWFASLPPDRTVRVRSGACYLVNEGIKLKYPKGLTIYGGTFRNDSVVQDPKAAPAGQPVFTVLGGSRVVFESMRVAGKNPGGYHAPLAFASGIELDGTSRATIRSVTITRTFGDGITLLPLRGGADHQSGTIVAPSSGITIRDVTIKNPGRQGVTFDSVSGAQVTDVIVTNPGFDTFDFEADQRNEGASDVTIDGCEASGGLVFFANDGAGGGRATSGITVAHCTMTKPEGGSAVLVNRPGDGKRLRGPIHFVDDLLWCGASTNMACVQLSGADVTVSDSVLRFPAGAVHEPVYHVAAGSEVQFAGDSVQGFGRKGHVSAGSTVEVSGGTWTPYSP